VIRIEETGGPEVLRIFHPDPVDGSDPPPGMARVRIEYAGVNFIDTYHRTGLYPMPLPFVPGVEATGRIVALGAEDGGFAIGDRVAWTGLPGCYADESSVPVARLVAIPEALSSELACASLLQGATAHYLTHGVRETRPGDVALVHAAAGGTGGLLVQMLHAAGARVIATCGTEAKAALARESGADEVILYTQDDFAARTRALTDGRGVDVAYDSVGQSTFEGSLASLRPRGLLCLFGQSSGPVPPFDLGRLGGAGSLFVTRPSLAHYIATREELELRVGNVFRSLLDGSLRQRIGGRYPLEEVARAHRDLEGRGTTGKLLLEVAPGD
jgi:NADPH2:quinone reductase